MPLARTILPSRTDQGAVTNHLFARKFHDVFHHAAFFFVNVQQLPENAFAAADVDINVIGPHHHEVAFADNVFGHQHRMPVAFRFALFGKMEVHSFRNNAAHGFQQIRFALFFQMLLQPCVGRKISFEQMFAGLVAVDENDVFNADLRTGVDRILNDRQVV